MLTRHFESFKFDDLTARLRLDHGMVESVKWVAVVLMLIDHVNRYVLGEPLFALYLLGRIAFPLFAVSFGISLLGRDQATMQRAWRRTLMWAFLAQWASSYVRDPAPINILFVLALGALIASQVERRTWWLCGSVLLALLLSPYSEFSVAGMCVAASGVYFGRHQNARAFGVFAFSISFLQVENGNPAALLALPLLAVLALARIEIPRVRNLLQCVYVMQFPLFLLAAGLLRGAQ